MTSCIPSVLDHDSGPLSCAIAEGPRPKRLLNLPPEILHAILKELHHTNDLTSLALCHSTLHTLVIPHIYSRFDIVWPDSASGPEPRTGVDALTFGLSTLVMAEDVFGTRRNQSSQQRARRRRGNYYAQHTRKFSLGNGPPEWIHDYHITKEGGKMLGTLVALAVARMRNLESFVWDMPSGILSVVFESLASLADHDDDIPCRLDKVAVRCHNNSADSRDVFPLPQRRSNDPPSLSDLQHVENPSFSILPPLRSLSVLDIDEVQYLDEMSVLVRRSVKLSQLRVGIAPHARHRDFVTVWDGDNVAQIDKTRPEMSCITIGEKRLGGVLGILTGLIFDLRSAGPQSPRPNRLRRRSDATIGISHAPRATDGMTDMPIIDALPNDSVHSDVMTQILDDQTLSGVDRVQDVPKADSANPSIMESLYRPNHLVESIPDRTKSVSVVSNAPLSPMKDESASKPFNKLALEVLELEQVPLSIPVLQNAFDWNVLTSLTLLHCPNHEHLWKTLRRLHSPSVSLAKHSFVVNCPLTNPSPKPSSKEFKLNLRHIHTDTVSHSLINFIKDTLRPNSLESVFFLHTPSYSSNVSLDTIYTGVLRRHRASLKKVLIDSGDLGAESRPEANSYWRQWMLNREVVKFLGKMPCLRELGAALDYRDWHFFLQNLPSMPQLRSLYIPFLVNSNRGNLPDTRELALQIVDIVALRPEIELCYLGIIKKCFEILEQRPGQGETDSSVRSNSTTEDDSGSEADADDHETSDDENNDDDDDDDDDDESQDAESNVNDMSDDSESDSQCDKAATTLKLREILYYDDKVSIFKARHGKL